LRLFGVVPEIRRRRLLLDLGYFIGWTGGVKDTPAGLPPFARGPDAVE
jgi:hypothetical protein